MPTGIAFAGKPIRIEFRPHLRACSGRLVCGGERGCEVHAGAFLLQRLIVLDRALLRDARERDRILTHELFHFVWWKLDRASRAEYGNLIVSELRSGVRGEMGWSSELRKGAFSTGDWFAKSRKFREYLSESFCDTAAACALGIRRHAEITLETRARSRRVRWMTTWVGKRLATGGALRI